MKDKKQKSRAKDKERKQKMYERMSKLRELLRGRYRGNVLEIGIGRGEFGNVVLDVNEDIVTYLGSDDFIEELEKASNRFARFICLPNRQAVKDDTINNVILANMLHHTKNPSEIISEASSLIRKQNGLLTIMEQIDFELTSAEMNHRDYHHWTGSIDRECGIIHNNIFTREQLENIVLEHSLVCFESHIIQEEKENKIDIKELAIIHNCMKEKLRMVEAKQNYKLYEEESFKIIKRIQCSGILRTRQLLMFLKQKT